MSVSAGRPLGQGVCPSLTKGFCAAVDISTLQGPELHLNVSVFTTEQFAAPACLSWTWTCLDNRSLCWSVIKLRRAGADPWDQTSTRLIVNRIIRGETPRPFGCDLNSSPEPPIYRMLTCCGFTVEIYTHISCTIHCWNKRWARQVEGCDAFFSKLVQGNGADVGQIYSQLFIVIGVFCCWKYLKWTVSWERFQKFWLKFKELGQTKGRGWFLNFLGAPMIL